MIPRCTLLDPMRRGPDAEKLDAALHEKVIGQDEAIQAIVEAYQMHLSGMANPERPVANFLFLGPTGTGKTRMVEALAEALAGDARAVVKIDCAEFQHSHEIAKLVGSPPGYLGHRETHAALSQEALDRYVSETVDVSFVLFDEIEKASDALWNLLLGILDKGTLTLGDNRKVDFTHSMIFMTSNLGAREMMAMATPGMGFTAVARPLTDLTGSIAHAGVEAARHRFSPEFMNRIDKVVVFHPLGTAELRRIVDLELETMQRRWRDVQPFQLTVSDAAKMFFLEEGSDLRYGARHLKRTIEQQLAHPMSNLIASAQVLPGDSIRVDFDPGLRRLLFYRDAEGPGVSAAPESAAGAEHPKPAPAAAEVALSRATAAPKPASR